MCQTVKLRVREGQAEVIHAVMSREFSPDSCPLPNITAEVGGESFGVCDLEVKKIR